MPESPRNAPSFPPRRIVCLSAETAEIVYALGQGDRVVGVSGYVVRPLEARRKPKVAAFTSYHREKLLGLDPDLVLAFSDLQKDIVRDLVGEGLTVLVLNQRSLAQTLDAIRLVGAVLGEPARAQALALEIQASLDGIAARGARLPRRPRVFFEEWDDPLISGIRWVGEAIRLAGGEDVFPELALKPAAAARIVDPAEVIRRAPEVIIASWCGKKVNRARIRHRPGWEAIPAVKNDHIYEIKSAHILQPGPGLLEGIRQIQSILEKSLQGPRTLKRGRRAHGKARPISPAPGVREGARNPSRRRPAPGSRRG
jgi:iron complex transport system substrate-binding protein